MFVGIAPAGASAEHELHAFHAESIRDPGTQIHSTAFFGYPRAPVVGRSGVTRVSCARPRIVGSGRHAITLNRVEALSRTSYAESAVHSITASTLLNAVATQTYNRDDRCELIDAIVRRTRVQQDVRMIGSRALGWPVRRRSLAD